MVPSARAADPSGWNIIPSVNTSSQVSNILLGTTCTNSWNCWAVGGAVPDINSNNAEPTAMTQHWNGSLWAEGPNVVPAGSKLSLLWNVTCVSSTDCWTVGAQMAAGTAKVPTPLAEHWNGTAWSVVPLPSTFGILFSVSCTGPSNCWAAGTTVSDDNQSNPLNGFIDHWNGSSWSQVPTAPSGQKFDQFNSVTCSDASDCWAVGFAGPNQLQNNFLPNVAPNVAGDQAFIEHWDGTDWTMVDAPAATSPQGIYLASVTCATPADCLAVGATMGADGNPSTTLVDRWNGSVWSTTPSPNPDNPSDLLTDVTCLGTSDCWAVGASGVHSGQNNNGIQPNPFIEQWNGSTWSIDPSPNVTAFGYLSGVSCTAGNGCFAAGFAATDSNNRSHLADTGGTDAPPRLRQPGVADGRRRRRGVQPWATPATWVPWAEPPQQTDRRHGGHAGRRRLLAGGLRRWGLLVR